MNWLEIIIVFSIGFFCGYLYVIIRWCWKKYEGTVERELEYIQSQLDEVKDKLPLKEGKDFILIEKDKAVKGE